MLCWLNSSMMHLICTAVVEESCLLSSEKKWVKHRMACEWLCCWFWLCMCWCTKVLHWNAFNINIYIAAILLKLYFVWKIGDNSIVIITTTQKYWNSLWCLNASRRVFPHLWLTRMRTYGSLNDDFCIYGV